jgi:hypothetical protein
MLQSEMEIFLGEFSKDAPPSRRIEKGKGFP